MYLKNSLYSNIDLYLNELNKYLKESYELKADYKTYDKQSNDDVTFVIFNIKSKLKNKENNFIINEFNYEGNFVFVYNKLLNQIIIKEVPTINYNNKIKLPVFTSDLANILVEKLNKYTELDNINITFENNLSVIAIDDIVKDIIPSIKDTRNYKILNVILETIVNEIKKIRQDVLNHKSHYDRLERSRERAINKKRVILGINPLEYDSEEKFNNVLNERIKEAYIKKYDKAKRHLELSQNKYKRLLDNDKLYDYFNYIIFETYLDEETEKEIPLEFKDIVLKAREEFRRYILKIDRSNVIIHSSNIKYSLNYWLEESNFYEIYKEKFLDAVYNFDFNNEFGALNTIKKMKKHVSKDIKLDEYGEFSKTLDSDEMIKCFCIELYDLPQSWLLKKKDTISLKYHPIFYDKNIEKELERYKGCTGEWISDIDNRIEERYRDECFNKIYPLYKSYEFASGYNLLHQIPKLIKIEQECNKNLENLDNLVLDFRTFSANWGNIINLPYWSVIDTSNHTTRGGYWRDYFEYFVVKPGIQKIDFSKVKSFLRNFHNKLLSGEYSSNIFEELAYKNRSMIFIPKSLDYSNVKTILDELKYTENDFSCDDSGRQAEVENNENQIFTVDQCCSKWLNIICEDLETYLFVKRYLLNKLINKDILPTRIFVNCDPEYYKNYLVEVPSAEVLWHKYDYVTSSYKYKRKYLFDLRGQLIYAKEYLNNILGIYENNCEYYDILEEILLGSYSSNPKYEKYINDFKEYLLLKEIDVLGGKKYLSQEQIDKEINYYKDKKQHRLKYSQKYGYKIRDEIALKCLIEGQKLREECSKITGISPPIEGENDCVKTLQRKFKKIYKPLPDDYELPF